ncbi:MAG TPA: ethanolamine ammonia-lyase subunit EutB [Candidatus Melainabacteria bacterium]|jgi:ethanolamine ammonia-lyase large subunit|nr:ethanolamine ammonia-lyase subunit EutB [Candidatus Melainabacteria bacterium]HIN64260.1 ethanolamine ammonia-lyase subunit EutB [Candidatus Obscuribacterales bacterium]
MSLSIQTGGKKFHFADLKDLLAKANEEKSGDQLAGISAASELERVAAKQLLAQVTLDQLRQEPVIPYEHDEVTRIIDDNLDNAQFEKIKSWTVAELREFLLSEDEAALSERKIGKALTGEMAAAVTKLMSSMDLVLAASKLRVVAKAKTTLGLKGRLAIRLQPNHPSDSLDGILASIYEGLSYGVGDAVIGINPAYDTPDTVARLLEATNALIEELSLPTQNCILSHLTTQLKAIERGAPAGLIFQSIAGCEKGNKAFGIDNDMLKEGSELGSKLARVAGGQYMYFETGQGSELSSHTHEGADQVTLEARCYALARQFDPFLVNDVVGFIGPEYLKDGRQMIRAGLEDHFMGKLLGVPMGIDACYTNHMNADQNDLENLSMLLTLAGVNYFMGVPMGDDVMLSYQSTSYHDAASLRSLMNLRPAPEFEAWLEERDLMKNGKLTEKGGNPNLIMSMRMANAR